MVSADFVLGVFSLYNQATHMQHDRTYPTVSIKDIRRLI